MRFVKVESEAQVDIQALHRIRDQKVSLRTHGIAIHQAIGKFKADFRQQGQ